MPTIKPVRVSASRRFAELKDTYLQLLQEGYNPQDVEKFVKEIQTNPNADAPKPRPGTKPLTTTAPSTSIGSMRKAEQYLAGKENWNGREPTYRYQLLDRLRGDCEFFLGEGRRNEKVLWAGNVRDQIQTMKDIYASLPEKPEWISEEDILRYEKEMSSKEEKKARKKASDADNFKGSKINEGVDKNPKANEDLESLKKNNFDRKTCKGSFSRKAWFGYESLRNIESDKYTIKYINDPEELMSLSRGTAWDLKNPKYAEMYARDGVYMIFRKGENKPFAAATSDFTSFVDRSDRDISGTPEGEEIKGVIEGRGKKGSFSASLNYLNGK